MIILTNKPQTEDEYQYSSSFISVCEDSYVMRLHSTNPDEDDIDVIMSEDELCEMTSFPKGCKIAYEFASIMQDGKSVYSLALEYTDGEYHASWIEDWIRFKDYLKWQKSIPNWKNTYTYKVHSYKIAYVKTKPIVTDTIPDDWDTTKVRKYLLAMFKDDLEKLKPEIDKKYTEMKYEEQEFAFVVGGDN